MRVSEIKELVKHLPGRTELLIIADAETEDGKKLDIGIGYFDNEEKELVYLGKITVIENLENEN